MENALVKFDLTEKEIAKRLNFDEEALKKVNKDYMAIVVKDVNDKEGFNAAHEARMKIVKFRVDIVKDAKAFRDEANTFSKNVIKVEKYIVGLVTPVEEHLQAQEDIINNEKARIKAENDAKEAARVQARVDKLYDMGLISRNGNFYLSFTAEGYVPEAIIKTCPDEDFNKHVNDFNQRIAIENARIEKEQADKKAEEERLDKIRKEQEVEFKRLAAIADEQKQREAKLKEAQDKIDADKKRIEDEEKARLKKIADDKALEIAKREAADKAVKEAEEKRIKEEKAKADKIEKDRIAAEKKAARQPDKAKLLAFALEFEKPANPKMNTPEGQRALDTFNQKIEDALCDLRERVGEL